MNFRAITGNRLRDGAVVFYNDDAGWVERLNDASLYEDKATAETTLASAKAQAEKERLAVDVYAIRGPGRRRQADARPPSANASGRLAPPSEPISASRPRPDPRRATSWNL